jgi:hypothetical protein
MIVKAKEVDRYVVHNGNIGRSTTIPESKMNECLIYFDTIQTLIKALGFNVFLPEVEKIDLVENPRFYYKQKDNLWNVEGVYIDEKFIVLKGSKSRKNPTKHKVDSNELRFRDKLIDDGVIKELNGELIFAKDYAFNSPSTAADIVSLGSNNGWKVWKTKDLKTLEEIYQRNVEKDEKINKSIK